MSNPGFMESLLEDGEDNALLRYTMASAFIKHGKSEQAMEQLKAATDIKPDYFSAWLLWAETLADNGKKKESVEIIKLALEKCAQHKNREEFKKLETLLHSLSEEIN